MKIVSANDLLCAEIDEDEGYLSSGKNSSVVSDTIKADQIINRTIKKTSLKVIRFGTQDYHVMWNKMSAFTDARDASTEDELWVVEHTPVFTLGKAGKPEHVLNPGNIPVVQSDRGGQVTYHGPGQLVVYPLIDLHRKKIGVKNLVNIIEECLINTLLDYEIVAQRRDGAPGVYVEDSKVAALGLRVRKGRSFHGMSLNVAMDLEPFTRINPCGYAGLAVTQLSDLIKNKTADNKKILDEVADALVRNFCTAMNCDERE